MAAPQSKLPRTRLAHKAAILAAAAATVAVSITVLPEMSSRGSPELSVLQRVGFDSPTPPRGDSPLKATREGYRIGPESEGRATFPVATQKAVGADHIFLTMSGASPVPATVEGRKLVQEVPEDLEFVPNTTLATLVGPDGERERLGQASEWSGRPIEVTELIGDGGPLRIEISSSNISTTFYSVFNGAILSTVPGSAVVDARPALVGLWLALIAATALLATGRLGRHWPLVAIAAAAGVVFWNEVSAISFAPLPDSLAALWDEAKAASWLGLDSGWLTGSAGESPLAVWLLHALTPIVGTSDAAFSAAGALLAVAVAVAVYLVAHRVAGRWPAVIAAAIVLLSDPFLSTSVPGPAPALALAGAAFAFAIHACTAQVSWREVAVLAAAGLLIVAAEPLWLPGALLATGFVAARYAPTGQRLRYGGLALALLALLLIPNRVSTANRFDGDPLGDLNRAAQAARQAELADFRQRAAPPSTPRQFRRRAARTENLIAAIREQTRDADSIAEVRAVNSRIALQIIRRQQLLDAAEGARAMIEAERERVARDVAERGPRARPTTLFQYLVADRSPQGAAVDVAGGVKDSVDAASDRPRTGLGGLVAYALTLLGGVYLLLVPRLRMLVLLPVVVTAPTLLMASRGVADPFLAGLPIWSGMVIGAAVLSYAVIDLLQQRYSEPLLRGRRLLRRDRSTPGATTRA